MSLCGACLDAQVWNVKRHLDPIPLKLPAAVTCRNVKRGIDGRKGGALEPGSRFAAGIKRRLQVHGCNGEVVIKLDIIFPGPYYLDRPPQFLREDGSFDGKVRKRLATESTT